MLLTPANSDSLCNIDDLLAKVGVILSYRGFRVWYQRFGAHMATKLRRDRPTTSKKRHEDEVVILIQGREHGLLLSRKLNRDVEIAHGQFLCPSFYIAQ